MGASASNDIYDVRLDIAFPPPAQVGEEDGKLWFKLDEETMKDIRDNISLMAVCSK